MRYWPDTDTDTRNQCSPDYNLLLYTVIVSPLLHPPSVAVYDQLLAVSYVVTAASYIELILPQNAFFLLCMHSIYCGPSKDKCLYL